MILTRFGVVRYAVVCVVMGIALMHVTISQGQDIPIGTWRAHLSYNRIISIAPSQETIFAASDMGIIMLDRSDKSISTLNKVSGLSGSGITQLAYNPNGGQLVVSYQDGNLDIVENNTVINFPRLKDVNVVTGSRRINDIVIRNNVAYLATDYGVVVFDLSRKELIETWRDLGSNGENIRISQLVFFNDSIAAATESGVIIGSLNDNLLDFNKWKRFNTNELNTEIAGTAVLSGNLYIAVDGVGIYRYDGHAISKLSILDGAGITSLESSGENLLITANGNLWLYNPSDQLIQVADDAITLPILAIQDDTGTLWVADSTNGLVSNMEGTFTSYLPNGPSFNKASRLSFAGGRMYTVAGGFTETGEPLENPGTVNYFENGLWHQRVLLVANVTDAIQVGNRTYFSSFGNGLLEAENGNSIVYNQNNSPLVGPSSDEINISDIASGASGLWVANYETTNSIHLLRSDKTWKSFVSTPYPTAIAIDQFENIWIAVNASHGGGLAVLNTQTGLTTYRTDVPGSGGLLNRNVRSLETDHDGYVWAGTDAGLGYFYSESQDAVIPIYEQRFLLRDETITAIEADGGNRKWIGTTHGIWVVSENGEEVVYNFTEENSPLLSDVILDIEINDQTGEVFISTDMGIVSFRADATEPAASFNSIKIFPNPVTSDFTGLVGIAGLGPDAYVKITDVSGKLIWQERANGGTVAWNVRDYNGRRAQTGIYLVFASSENGTESVVGKIAVID